MVPMKGLIVHYKVVDKFFVMLLLWLKQKEIFQLILKMLYVQAQPKNFASIKDPKEISLLLKNIKAYDGGLVVRTVLRIAPYVFVRPGELHHTQWDEFDFEKQEWRIPAKKMKMCQIHIVPLTQQVIKILKELQSFTRHTEYLFQSMWSICRPISDVTLLAELRRMGYTKEQMTVHGFRSIASTLLNEQGYNRDWIERQLAHGGGGDVTTLDLHITTLNIFRSDDV